MLTVYFKRVKYSILRTTKSKVRGAAPHILNLITSWGEWSDLCSGNLSAVRKNLCVLRLGGTASIFRVEVKRDMHLMVNKG